MGKYHSKIIAALGLMAALLSGCELEQEVPIPEHEPRLTLRLALTNAFPDSTHYRSGPYNQLYIGRSQSVLQADEELKGITNASMTLYNEAGQAVETYRHTGMQYGYYQPQPVDGYYEAVSGFVPEPGKTYTIRATAPGFQTIEATTRLPMPSRIVEASLEDRERVNNGYFNGIEGTLKVVFQDNPDEQNYYQVLAYPLDSAQARMSYYSIYPRRDRTGPELGMQEQLWLGTLFSDELYNSGQITLNNRVSVTTSEMEWNGKIRNTHYLEVQVQQLTKDEYLFYKTLRSQRDNDGNPFAEYVQVHRNVQNGYGVLGGVTISRQVIPLR
jgi:hypothetical protein